ncbi:MAG: hypothetical protein AB8F74_11900 [Saprospiraceae bacterium]
MTRFVILLLAMSMCLLSACTSDSKSEARQSTEPPTVKTTKAIVAQIPGDIPVVKYHPPSIDRTEEGKPEGSPFVPKLMQEVFPLDAGGLDRFSGANGAPKLMDNQMGSETRMVYKDRNTGQQIALSIRDSGTLGLTMDQIVDWIKNPRNSETENTIDRTGSLKGFPYHEYYVKDAQIGELHLLVNKRFEVVAKGEGVSYETLRGVMDKWDLASLY